MRPFNRNEQSYYCPGCGKTFVGRPMEVKTLDGDHEGGTREENVYWIEEWHCHDGFPPGSNPCIKSEDDFEFSDECWECGDCHTLHGDMQSALLCCT